MAVSELRPLLHGSVTSEILRLFFRVHDRLGFGYLESVYCKALEHEFTKGGIAAERETPIDVWYDGACVGRFRADFVVAGRVIVEVKACEAIDDAHRKQLMNYMRGSRLEVGLLLHFGPKAKFHRVLYTNDRKPELRTPRESL